MSSPLRIAILECDTPVPEVHKRYNGYGGVFSTLLKSSAKTLHLDPETDLEITAFNIVDDDKYPKLEDVDAILLSGSSAYIRIYHIPQKPRTNNSQKEHNSFEDHPWILRLVEFTKMVLAQDRVRILGICFGHQIIGRALDSKVGRSDKGWEISVCDMDLTDKGKELFGREKLVRYLFMAQKYTANLNMNSASSKCTRILSFLFPRAWSRLDLPRVVRCRECMRLADLLRYRVIRSLMGRL
jgi:GMP synthase-like glutamine amidotransferase